ncbi:DUF3144 domain-containing protein [Luminiphilus sp.]|nr:DUF3144 domain-containing protein [Luminiphilus sp.]
MSVHEEKMQCVNEFIALANAMKDKEISLQMVSSSLMTASALYATYTVAGNEGALKEAGIKKLTELFGLELESVQKAKIAQAEREGKDVSGAL